MAAPRSSSADIMDSMVETPFSSHNKSKIPRLKRTQSLRLKGEKFLPLLEIESQLTPSPRSTLTLSNLKVFESGKQIANGSCCGDGAEEDCRHLVTKPASLVIKGSRGSRPTKASSPSEYGSLPPTPVPSPDADGSESMKSFRSFGSMSSLDAFASASLSTIVGRRKKFVVHCQSHAHDYEEYLTPTQRKDRLIRQLKAMLLRANRELDEKDVDIMRLSKEIIDLKLFKAEAMTVSPTKTVECAMKTDGGHQLKSFDDINLQVFKSARTAGHYEQNEGGSAMSSSYDSGLLMPCADKATSTRDEDETTSDTAHYLFSSDSMLAPKSATSRPVVQHIIRKDVQYEEMLKREIEDVKRLHSNEYQELKEKYNDRIESLLQKLSEANTRYFDLRPKYDQAREEIRMLEKQIQSMEKDVDDHNSRHHQMYLKMYKKGQEAARFEHADEVLEFAHTAPKRVSVPEILKQLQLTERELEQVKALYRREVYTNSNGATGNREAEITLKFLKDAVYYFLTDKDSRDHLRAIESIMGYSECECMNIERSLISRNKFI